MKQVALAVAGPVSVLLAHYAAVISHEYAHSFMAFALGYKSNPLIIHWGGRSLANHWGGRSLANLLLLININEQVDYATMFARAMDWPRLLSALPAPDWPTVRSISCRFSSCGGRASAAMPCSSCWCSGSTS